MMTFMKLATLFLLVLGSICARAQASESNFKGDDWEVKIEDVRKVADPPHRLYRVTFSYLFSNRQSIWIDGLGTVLPEDRLTFTTAAALKFRDAKGKSPLATVPLASNIYSQPLEKGVEYPLTITSATSLWKPYGESLDLKLEDKTFTGAAMKALLKPSNGAVQSCRPDDGGCIFTAWIRVFTGDRSKGNFNQGDVAVMLVHKPAVIGAEPGVHLVSYYVVRQGLAGSPDWDYNGGTDVQKAAAQFLDHLISQLSAPTLGGGK